MSALNEIKVLEAQIKEGLRVLDDIALFYGELKQKELRMLGESQASAMLLADIFISFYTCCETIFVRISRFFENNLDPSRWHKELLERMTLTLPDLRPRVLSPRTVDLLDEFLRFRHFKRYYFEFTYDWKRIVYLEDRYNEILPLLRQDLARFSKALNKIEKSLKG